MSVAANANAYVAVQKQALDGRELEAAALLNTAQRLQECVRETEAWNTREGLERLDEALRRNQKLWTVFQVELENPEHPMPLGIRHNLLRLIRYIDRTTFELMACPRPGGLDSLIRINTNIAQGLLSRLDPESAVEAPPEENERVEIEF